MKQNSKLLELIMKLEVTEFIGLARILKVQLVEEINSGAAEPSERYATRDFTDVLGDVLYAFDKAPRARRREILQILKAASQKEGKS